MNEGCREDTWWTRTCRAMLGRGFAGQLGLPGVRLTAVGKGRSKTGRYPASDSESRRGSASI
jgi:hypothetical protein